MTHRHPFKSYLFYALAHPWHMIFGAAASILAVANWNWLQGVLFFAGVEVVVLAFLLMLPAFRRYVDDRILYQEKEKATGTRDAILLQMSGLHQHTFQVLENKIQQLKVRLAQFPAVSSLVADECTDLLGQYVQLAIHHNLTLTSIDLDGFAQLCYRIKVLQSEVKKNHSPIVQQCLEIADKRRALYNSSTLMRVEMERRLEGLEQLILLKIEQSVLPAADLPHIQLRVDDTSFHELGEFVQVEEVDMKMMALGRSSS